MMRTEAEIHQMLKEIERFITDDTDSEDPEQVIADVLVWVLFTEVGDGRILDYLPD